MGVESTGRVVWHDCMTTDIDKSVEFYSKLFGWKINSNNPITIMNQADATEMPRCSVSHTPVRS